MPTLNEVFVPHLGREFKFQHRDSMERRSTNRRFARPSFIPKRLPPTTLPIDSTGGGKAPCPMDANDQYGDCGEAMAAHADNILTFRQGKGTASTFAVADLVKQYLAASGGDNGLDEETVVNTIWKKGVGGNKDAVCVDSLDIDITDSALSRFAIDNFYTIQMAWSVPNNFIQNFTAGSVWPKAGKPNRNNGHFTVDADVLGPDDKAPDGTVLEGFVRNWTWGAFAYCSPEFIESVEPECFIVFSPRQFDKTTGLDSKGRHITTQAAIWQTCGGNAIPSSVINAFPAAVASTPPLDWSSWV